MKFTQSLNARLVISHLSVSLISIALMAFFAGRLIFSSANAEVEQNLQSLAFAIGNALELPLQELREGRIETISIRNTLKRLFSDYPDLVFTVYKIDGTALVDSSDTLPPRATPSTAPEVWTAIEEAIASSTAIRPNADGEQYIYVAVPVQSGIELTAILRLGIPLERAQAEARRSLLGLLLAALLIASGVSLVGWRLANNLARPIGVLTQAAGHMEGGDLSVRVRPAGTRELRRLAEAFNSMANKLQSNVTELRSFVANASHELRTPLTVVKLRTESLANGALDDTEVASRFIAEIDSEIDRLIRMVNDMLDLSRMEAMMDAGKRSDLNLSTIVREAYDTFKYRAERAHVSIDIDIEPGLPSVNGNEDQLRRVFYNLLENAIKYTPDGGHIDMLMRTGPKENTIRILVRDNGPGISAENLAHIFERFYRAETSQPRSGTIKGSGLGLAIAKSIIEGHGGEIGANSQPGTGSTFWVDLPAKTVNPG